MCRQKDDECERIAPSFKIHDLKSQSIQLRHLVEEHNLNEEGMGEIHRESEVPRSLWPDPEDPSEIRRAGAPSGRLLSYR